MRNFTLAEYFQYERTSGGKSEFFQGEILTMPNNSANHNLITAKLISLFEKYAAEKNWLVYASDMRFFVPLCLMTTYPDLMILAEEPQYQENEEDYVLLNPSVVVEVYSNATEIYDRAIKLPSYLTVSTMKTVMLVCETEKHIEIYYKIDNEHCCDSFTTGDFEVLNCKLNVEQIYSQIHF